MKRSILYRFFSLLVLAGLFLSCANPVYTREEDGGDDDNGGNGSSSESETEGPALVSIDITKIPSKTTYEWGEELDISGMEVTGTYDDGRTRIVEVSRSNISGYSPTTEGVQRLRVSIQGKSATFTVVVWDFIKIKVINPSYIVEVILPPGSVGSTSLSDWRIGIRAINGGPAPYVEVSPQVDGCRLIPTGTLSPGSYEITVIFRETYIEKFQIQVTG
ncbi:MAG: bacterial Ig-like domain-containing protein [Treponema sp.]|jgi:hypothetical protein|nr:bacterial Ig-like domain-containing protein [Treponema sp.]